MIEVRRHIPAFVDRDGPPERATVSSFAELEAIPWIAEWKREPRFRRFSLSRNHLMAELEPDGDEFYVLAYLRGDMDSLGLPAWVETDNARRRREAWNRGEVWSILSQDEPER